MQPTLNPDLASALPAAVAYLADAVREGAEDISIPISGAYLNGMLWSCGRAARYRTGQGDYLEVALLGTSRAAQWVHHEQATAIELPDPEDPPQILFRRLTAGLADLFRETVAIGFGRHWEPFRLERLSALTEEAIWIRDGIDSDETQITEEGHVFRQVASSWIWAGRAP